jgi:hypothetical protein
MLTREVLIRPAYDRRSEGYGIHGVEMCFVVKGPKGAVQFVVFTNWHLPHVTQENINGTIERAKNGIIDPENFSMDFSKLSRSHLKCIFLPMAADLGYHSPVPMYEDQKPMSAECQILGGECYYDGSTLNAEPVFELMVREGGDALWVRLEQEYRDRFEEAA